MEPVERASTGRPEVAVTYDDGPGPGTVPLLRLLAAHAAPATFFMAGEQAERSPAIARRVALSGHEVGSHSMCHLDHAAIPAAEAVADMLAGAKAVEDAVMPAVERAAARSGGRADRGGPRLYRAPYGHFVPATLEAAAERGWTSVGWSAMGEDWLADATGPEIAKRVLGDLAPGVIVLLHDGRREKPCDAGPMLEATAILLAETERRGLRPVTVSALLR